MTQGMDTKKQLARLEQVLDTYGTDPSRWPASERATLGVLMETQPQAHQLFSQAQALERVMDSAPLTKVSDALKARIVTAAINDPERKATVVPIRPAPVDVENSISVRQVTAMWPAAALAASFALGLYLGVSGVGDQPFEGVFQIASISNPGDTESISWLDAGSGSDAEDLL